jgi:hypothetical protein
MKKIIDTRLKVVGFQFDRQFRFPGDEAVYGFFFIEYIKGKPVVRYWDKNGNNRAREGCCIDDLIWV